MQKWIFSVVGYVLLALPAQACGLRVLTEDLPPYQVVKNHQVVAGSAFLQVEAIFKSAGLPCRTEVLPWARAYELARTQPNTLVYSLARLPAREDLFIWLAPLLAFADGAPFAVAARFAPILIWLPTAPETTKVKTVPLIVRLALAPAARLPTVHSPVALL